jgi:hypothetical protein
MITMLSVYVFSSSKWDQLPGFQCRLAQNVATLLASLHSCHANSCERNGCQINCRRSPAGNRFGMTLNSPLRSLLLSSFPFIFYLLNYVFIFGGYLCFRSRNYVSHWLNDWLISDELERIWKINRGSVLNFAYRNSKIPLKILMVSVSCSGFERNTSGNVPRSQPQ